MNNAFFGKTMENVRDRVNLEFIDHTQIQQIIKRQSKLSFKGIVDHYSKFSVYKFDKEKTLFDKPIYLGFTVLELSKLLMYEFYYNILQPYWQNKIQLHYMDTDSFILSFDTNHQELINFLQENKDEFDFSELDNTHELYNPINKKVIGKMKIETSPVLVLDSFTALRSKSYSFSYNNIQKAKQKGIQKAPACEEYTRCLFMSETTSSTNISIRSNLNNLTVEKQPKLCLNPFDDKRMYLNSIKSLPWDIHTQKGYCPCIYCLELFILYRKDIQNENCETYEEIYYNIWTLKEKLNLQEIIKLLSDRAHLL